MLFLAQTVARGSMGSEQNAASAVEIVPTEQNAVDADKRKEMVTDFKKDLHSFSRVVFSSKETGSSTVKVLGVTIYGTSM